jgi:hypothetical protein
MTGPEPASIAPSQSASAVIGTHSPFSSSNTTMHSVINALSTTIEYKFRCYSLTSRYAHEVQVVIATTGFAFGEPQPTGSHCTPVGRTATIRRRLTGHPRLDLPSQTCPAAGLVTDTRHLLHISEDSTIRFWVPRGRVNASAARFPPSDLFCLQNVAGSNVERLDDPAAIAVMPAVDSPDVSGGFQQFCFGHTNPQCFQEQRMQLPRLLFFVSWP